MREEDTWKERKMKTWTKRHNYIAYKYMAQILGWNNHQSGPISVRAQIART